MLNPQLLYDPSNNPDAVNNNPFYRSMEFSALNLCS